MNPPTAVAFAVAAIFAVGDWLAVARRGTSVAWQRVEYVCKPATLAALVVAAATLDPVAGADARRDWFVAALLFSLLGDVLLMLPREQFVGGLVAFLVAHLCYIAGFWTAEPPLIEMLVVAVIVAVAFRVLAGSIVPGVRRTEPALVGPVVGYMVVIGVMLAIAIATGNLLAGLGAALFAGSDSMIAWNRFVRPFPAAGVGIMVTYHLGQALLVASLLRR
jgi:uncharacterized membrane protein YhhN